jgi:deltex-like protein
MSVEEVLAKCQEVVASSEERCSCCLDEYILEGDESEACVVLPAPCKHKFHAACIRQMLANSGKCALCGYFFVKQIGDMPLGSTMTTSVSSSSLPGHEGCGTITIQYHIPSGSGWTGTNRIAYLPNSAEGQECLGLLRRAFEQRLTFTVGTSLTTGQQNVAVWNGIHHKTSPVGGPTCFGYPDLDYLQRLRLELANKGITT